MSVYRSFGPFEKRLNAESSTAAKYEAFTPFYTSVGVDEVQFVLKAKGHDGGQLKGAVAVQFADVRGDNPGPWLQLDPTFLAPGNGERNSTPIVLSANGKAVFRFGVFHKLDSGSAYSESGYALEGAFLAKGEILATATLDITLDLVNVWQSFAITDFMPTIHVDKAKWVMVATSVEGNGVETRGVYRTADTSIQTPTAWRVASTDWSPSYASNAGAGEFAPAEYAINTNATHAYVQFGGAARFTSGTSARVTLHLVLIKVVD